MKKQSRLSCAEEARLRNIIDMAMGFSAMMRLFAEGSKRQLHEKILATAREVFEAESERDYIAIHSRFCIWGIASVMRAEREKNGVVTKKATHASYGQMAKTLDVALSVAIYYCHLPDCVKSQELSPWLNSAVDTKMMAMLRRCYPKDLQPWPRTIEQVDSAAYAAIQKLVRRFIEEVHKGSITPAQFDDIYWRLLNKGPECPAMRKSQPLPHT